MQSPKYTAAFIVTVVPIAGKTNNDEIAKKVVVTTICPTPIMVTVFHYSINASSSTSNPAMKSKINIPTSEKCPSVVVSNFVTPTELTITPTRIKDIIVDCLA